MILKPQSIYQLIYYPNINFRYIKYLEGQILKTNELLKEKLNEYTVASESVKKTKEFFMQKNDRFSLEVESEKFKTIKTENLTDQNEENIYFQNKEEE